MPEESSLKAWYHRLNRYIEGTKDRTGQPPHGRLIIYPSCFTLGTKTKKYTTCFVEQGPYKPEMDAADSDHFPPCMLPSKWDETRSKRSKWEYLMHPRNTGPVSAATRGKSLCIAAGQHCATIRFGLEAHLLRVSRQDFEHLVAESVPGPSPSAARSTSMRSFKIPLRFNDPRSRNPEEHRLLNVFLAVVCEDVAWLVVDFARLVQFTVRSLDRNWTQEDLKPGSQLWLQLWTKGKCGPDLNFEREDALRNIFQWRDAVRSQEDPSSNKTIYQCLCDLGDIFNGFGKHTACDMLFLAMIFPFMPAFNLCSEDTLFDHFLHILLKYVEQWNSPEYLRRVGGLVNSDNPFTFQHNSNAHYLATWVKVYRKQEAKVEQKLYKAYQDAGLLDPTHTIGKPYTRTIEPSGASYKWIPIFQIKRGSLAAYTIIRARIPFDWGVPEPEKALQTTDVRRTDYKTSLGVASYMENVKNKELIKPDYKGKPGRHAVEKTGRRGRPRKPLTAKQTRALAQQQTSRRAKVLYDQALDSSRDYVSS